MNTNEAIARPMSRRALLSAIVIAPATAALLAACGDRTKGTGANPPLPTDGATTVPPTTAAPTTAVPTTVTPSTEAPSTVTPTSSDGGTEGSAVSTTGIA